MGVKLLWYPWLSLRGIGVVMLSLGVIACSNNLANPVQESPRVSGDVIGWLHGPCLAINNAHIANNERLSVISLTEPQQVIQAHVKAKVKNGDTCFALLEDRRQVNQESGASFYTIVAEDELGLGIGVIQSQTNTSKWLTVEDADVDGDGQRDYFSLCTRSEGLQFSIWNGEPDHSQQLWSAYYYMGYDMDADCAESD